LFESIFKVGKNSG